ncbi:retrovirus-related pol polyprotein from transposon TNT 1-94 [Tanacetum coccineum]
MKEAMADHAWIEAMHEELHQFERLDVWELVDKPIDPHHPDKVYRLKKALYGLTQAPKVWYNELLNFLVSKGCLDTCKSTPSGIQFLGDKLLIWSSKKQDCTAMSTAEAEYVSLSASCAQLADLFTKAMLKDRFEYFVRRLGMRCLTPSEPEVPVNESA